MAAGEVKRTLYDRVSGTVVGKGPEDRNAVGDEVTKRSGFWAVGLKRGGPVAEGAVWIVVGRRLLER